MADPNKAWGRRLIVCCDGTWQSSVVNKENIPSNVTKLVRLIKNFGTDENNKQWHQIVYYDSGIGTGDLAGLEVKRQGGTGAGLMENVIEAYNFIVSNYESGDEIFCFGFSRGAFTARAVAGLVADFGILKPLEMQFFPRIYRAYMRYGGEEVKGKNGKALKDKEGKPLGTQAAIDLKKGLGFRDSTIWQGLIDQKTFIDHPPSEESRQIKVVGVWDTVGSLGVPDILGANLEDFRKKYGFHNVKLSRHVDHAYHALALDERRAPFRPTLWYIDPKFNKHSELKQVWFPGVHINCGGGSDDVFLELEGDVENISVATFAWMLQCIAPHLTIDQKAFRTYLKQYEKWVDDIRNRCVYHHKMMHESWIRRQYNRLPNIPFIGEEPDSFADPVREAPHPHPDLDVGWGVGPMVDNYDELYQKSGWPRPRQPGHEEMEIDGEWTPIKGIQGDEQHPPTGFKTHEYIHPLVEYRRLVLKKWDIWKNYPSAHPLKDWMRKSRTETDGSKRHWWYKPGGGEDDRLPEWCILKDTEGEINYERTWYIATKAMNAKNSEKQQISNYLEQLDKEIKFYPKRINEWES